MTQSQTMTVEQTEILARAAEIESAMTAAPTNIVANACALQVAVNAAQQLNLNAYNMRIYLAAGYQEWQKLAQSMRNAAKAYGEVDEDSAQVMNNDGQGSVSAHSAGTENGSVVALGGTPTVKLGRPDFIDLKTAATQIEQPDQGASAASFRDAWIKYNLKLQEMKKLFRPFRDWTGDAAAAVTVSMEQQSEWLDRMAKTSVAMAKQGDFVADSQRTAYVNHPKLYDIQALEAKYNSTTDQNVRQQLMQTYAIYQQKSDDVLSQYSSSCILEAVQPPKPAVAVKIDLPPDSSQQSLIPSYVMKNLKSGTGGSLTLPMMPPTMSSSSMSESSGSVPTATGVQSTNAVHDVAHAPAAASAGMKPMSFSGGGIGGASVSPLVPKVYADSARPAATSDVAEVGRGAGSTVGAVGGGGMGMPMGAYGAGYGSSKTKGTQQDDEALYTEDRAWTEAVIGNRRRRDSKELK
ncbi:secretion protein EspB [Mycobacterium uberis]|uniref:Secretion protein EspB n=1 Tax=Mycobacterium uberis TaxID=2162698 RepID=A0A3E1HLE2_9MYCO|nr:secretion protein EspB [Mycobacterium uberis]RFD27258.1 secretion protein EspB [Mycobacterium uberis]